jgi:hypothetical protein
VASLKVTSPNATPEDKEKTEDAEGELLKAESKPHNAE